MKNGIFDSHAHYSDESFDDDRDELLGSLESNGICGVMLAACDVEDSFRCAALAQRFDDVYSSAGIHPEYASAVPDGYLCSLDRAAKNLKVKAIGEIGLDYHYPGFDREAQLSLLQSQLGLARDLGLPVILHSRDATADMLTVIRKFRPRGVMHCFGGSAETALELVSLGMYIGFTGVITFKNARKSLEAAAAVACDRILIETDCPYMSPEPWRGTRNDSRNLVSVVKKLAEVRKTDCDDILELTAKNAAALFEIDET